MAVFKVGDMVKRVSGSWRGVGEGDVKKVSRVSGNNLQLEGYPDINFDGSKFVLYLSTSSPSQQFERGQLITYKYHDGGTYQGLVQDVSTSMLGVRRGINGEITYDAVNITDVISLETALPTAPREFKIGDRVRMIGGREPRYRRGNIPEEEVGVIRSIDRDGDFEVDFPSKPYCTWTVHPDDIEHADTTITFNVQHLPEVTLDEAVGNWQDVTQQIKELQAKASTYERVMRNHGIKPI